MEKEKKNYMIGLLTGMILMVAVYIGVTLFYPGLLAGGINRHPALGARGGAAAAETAEAIYPTIGSKVDDILRALDGLFVDPIDMEELGDQIFRSVVRLLGDPYTSYMDARQFRTFMEGTEGVYTGIGVLVTANLETGFITVVVPFEGFPGANAGLLPGDAIIKVDGNNVSAEYLQEAVNMLRGEPGTAVNITIYRSYTNETFDINVIREIITVPTVNHKMIDDDIGYLRITQFERPTFQQFVEALEDLQNSGMRGLILDLRNNPGGLLSTVVQITDLLVPEGTIVYTVDRHGRQVITPSGPDHIGIPMLILVNGQSASASEVLSGAVRDHGVGQLVGTTTFGKGLVQNIFPLADQSALRITVARYYTPNGFTIQSTGLEPDFEIDMDIELTVRLQQLTIEEDVQLRYAIDIMTRQLGQ